MTIAAKLTKKTEQSEAADPKAEAPVDRRAKPGKADPIVQVMRRNKELERRTQKALGVNVILALACMASIGANVFLGTRPLPEPRYIVQQNDGTLTPVIPLSQPISNKNAITQIVTDAISSMHAIDFKNYKGQLTNASTYFTRNGWQRYLDEMARTGTFEALEKRQLVLNATVNQPPVITKEYNISGIYAWDVEVPYQVNYNGAGFNQSVQLVARVTLVRIPTTDNPRGVAIAGFNATRP